MVTLGCELVAEPALSSEALLVPAAALMAMVGVL